MIETCHTHAQLQLLYPFGMFVCMRVFMCMHLCLLVCMYWCLCPLSRSAQWSTQITHLLSGLPSQQAHLEISFKTAVHIELCGETGEGSDFKNVLLGVGPIQNWAFGKRQIERRNGSD